MKRLLTIALITGFSFAGASAEQPAGPGVVVTTATPGRHDIAGGSRIVIKGTGFLPGLDVTINDQPLSELTYYHPTRMSGRVPANPAGSYDLVVRDAPMGTTLAVLADAVEYVTGLLPAPEDARAVRLDQNTVKLTWSNLIRYESIEVRRNGQPLYMLTGYPAEFIDFTAPYGAGQSIEYELIGIAGGRASAGTGFFSDAVRPECLEFLGEGASGRWDEPRGILLHGNEVQICFSLETAVNALGISVQVKRVLPDGQLKARIRERAFPFDVVIDDIAFEEIDLGAAYARKRGQAGPLAAGDYVLGLYADGTFLGHPFAIAADASDEDAGYVCPPPEGGLRAPCIDPCPPPPYPLVWFQPYCFNVPPLVQDIVEEVPVLIPGEDALWIEPPVSGAILLEERTLMLRAVAEDPDGTIESYTWNFGDGTDAVSGGANVTHKFPDFTCYTVEVTVEDDDRLTDARSELFCVEEFCTPPSAGSPPAIGGIRPDPDKLTSPIFIGGIPESPDQEYSVVVCAAVDALIDTVTMQMRHPDSGAILASETAEPRPLDQQEHWTATFDMGDPDLLGLESVILRVIAQDDSLKQSPEDFSIPLCPLPAFYSLPFVERDITYRAPTNEYELAGTIHPDPPMLDFSFDFFGDWDNFLNAEITHTQRLRNRRWYADPLDGSLQLTVLDNAFDLANLPPVRADDPGPHDCDDYEITYGLGRDHIQLIDEEWEFDVAAAEACIPEILTCLEFSLGFGASVDVDAHVGVELRPGDLSRDEHAALRGDAPVTVTFDVIPAFDVWATTDLALEFALVVAKLSLSLRPSIGITLPASLTVDAPDFDLDLDVSDCFTFALDYRVQGCVGCVDLWFADFGCADCLFDTGWDNLWNDEFSFSDSCPAGRGGLEGGAFPPPPQLKYPSIAMTPNGATSMILYVKNVSTDPSSYKPELYSSVDSGGGFSSPAPLFSPADSFTQRDSNLVFLSNSQALAIWTQARLTGEEEALLPDTIDGMNTVFKNQDIFFAIWNATTGWGAPQRLTDDATPNPLFPDGRPAVAAIGSSGAAWAAWVRSDNENMFDSSSVRLTGMSIYARKIQGGVASGPAVKLSAGDETNPAVDAMPAIAVSPSGNVALAVWVRDQDSDFGTSDDRYLLYSVNFAGMWMPAQPITDPMTLPGVLSPSVALSSDVDGMLAFTVRDVDSNGVIAAAGNRDLVYTIEIAGATFQPALPLERHRAINGGRVFGTEPIVRFLDPTNATVVFRGFDKLGSDGGDGELTVATIDLSQSSPRWSFARNVTDDDQRDWEIAAAVSPYGTIRTVRDSAAAPTGFDGLVVQDIPAATPDLAVDRLLVSNPYTPAGNEVELTIVLRNNGLATPQTFASTIVHLGEMVGDVFQEVAAIPFVLAAAPDQTQRVVHTVWMPVRSAHMRAIADPIAGETDTANNSADVILGVLPPAGLQCEVASQASRPSVSLTWDNGELYDAVLVYRNGRLRAELPGSAESHLDADVGPGDHTWSVRGRISRAFSDPDAAVCTASVHLPGDFDGDGDVDLVDYAVFASCLDGPGAAPDPTPPVTAQDCLDAFDSDGDGDVDLDDYTEFQLSFR